MALKVAIQESKNVSLWREYKDKTGKVLARFKIRGVGYKPYQVGLERAQNQIISKGYEVDQAKPEDKQWHDLLMQAAACHLIEEWDGIEFDIGGEVKEMPCTPENATQLLSQGHIGFEIWAFVKDEAHKIQLEADGVKEEVLGKSESSTNGKPSTATSQTTKRSKGKRSTSPS